MTERASTLVTLLFTDLVSSTELLARAGDEQAERVFRAHHDLLAKAATTHGGEEVKWLGDGLMVAFGSAADAVSCAVAMQEAAVRPVQGERLKIRVGLNAGEALRDAADYFGSAVVIARRLCDRAQSGQILCTEVVASLLAGRQGFTFEALGKLELKGLADPVAACEVRYEVQAERGLATRTEFVGRQGELRRLVALLANTTGGEGGLVVIAGDPGIGKTRLVEELAERARRDGALVLWGRCLEGEWSPPYAPFAEALDAQVAATEPERLRVDLGAGAAPIAQLVPRVRQVLPDIPEPTPVQPDEERFRLLEAVAQFLVARSRRAPVLLCLDDLHWADKGSVAMLRHVARTAPRNRILVVGAYREVDVDKSHPLADALGALRREVEYERLDLKGLDTEGVTALLAGLGEHDVDRRVGAAWLAETDDNPFFIRELCRHLMEEGHLYRGADGRWTTDRPIRELGVPEGVREVVARRLARLSEEDRKLLSVASAFEGPFLLDVVASVAEIDEDDALDVLDRVLEAQVLQPTATADVYVFVNAVMRHTVYAELSPSRQVRLHRKVAEALEAAYGEELTPTQAGEVASQYHRSRGRPGAERGVEPALLAAAHAESTGAHDQAAQFLRVALDLLPEADPRRPRLLARLGTVLAWALSFEEAVQAATEAAEAITGAEGADEAADYLAEATYACGMAGGAPQAWALAREGLARVVDRRDVGWARLLLFDYQRREAEDPERPGIPLDTEERKEAAEILRAASLDPAAPSPMEAVFASRDEALGSANLFIRVLWAGEYGTSLPPVEAEARAALNRGQFARAARCFSLVAMCQAALGQLAEARQALDEAEALAARLGTPVPIALTARAVLASALDEGWDDVTARYAPLTALNIPALAFASGVFVANAARSVARQGQAEEALRLLGRLTPWLEHAPAWTLAFNEMACHAAEVLWLIESTKHASLIDRSLRDKVVGPDFRFPMVDGRLALARLYALQGRTDEAVEFFAESRRVLDEQGARPLRAIADHDEALMYLRREEPGDAERARPLLEAALAQFQDLGMTGWVDQARERLDGLANND